MFGESRRIEYDEVVDVVGAGEELEGVLGKGFVAVVAGEVQRNVGACQVYGLGAAVYGMYQFGAATQGVYGKATGVAEHVEYFFPLA